MRTFVLFAGLLVAASCGGSETNENAGSGGTESSGAGQGGTGGGASSGTPSGAGGDSAGSSGSSGSGSGTTSGAGGAPPGSFTMTFDGVKVQPGMERTQCVVKRLGNEGTLRVGAIHNVLTTASHHLIVYRTNDAEEKLEPFDCTPFLDTLNPEAGAPLAITQKHDELITLPKGVAFSLEPNQMIRLEVHYLNVGQEEIDVTSSTTFVPIPENEFQHEADFLFIGNPDIQIPPNAEKTLGPTYFPLPKDLEGSQFFGITGHTHQWGTNVWVATTPGKKGPDTPVYDVPNWLWSEPETVYHDPPFVVPPGGGFRFTCSWKNLSSKTVGFGESANDEMCFFWAYYYPSQGARVCAHTDQLPGGFDLCCPGSALCGQIF